MDVYNYNDTFEKIQQIGKYENQNHIPASSRLTEWFGDYSLFESKHGVSSAMIEQEFEKINQSISRQNTSLYRESMQHR